MAEYKYLCTKYIDDLIKKHKLYDSKTLSGLLKKYKYEYNHDMLMGLSNYYDYLEYEVEEVPKREPIDNDWDDLTAELWKSEPDEMRTLQVSCKQYWSAKHQELIKITRGK